MSHFAKIDHNNIVTEVLVIEQEQINSGYFGDARQWIQTSYNTRGGVHSQGGTPLRKNYAGIGYKYDAVRDAFIPPQPYPSWTLNEETCLWSAPVPLPDDTLWTWDEPTLNWVRPY